MKVRLKVPTIYHSAKCCPALFQLWQAVNQSSQTPPEVVLDFQNCSFLSHLGVAFLGGLAHYIQYRGGQLDFEWNTLQPKIRTNLAQNGFLSSFGAGPDSWSGNSISYRTDNNQDDGAVLQYLLDQWLGRSWVNVSSDLKAAIAGQVSELYCNAFEHSQSSIGIFSCGQHYPTKKELHLTIVDFGQGIPTNVQSLSKNAALNSAQALEWAFQEGTSTVANGVCRGLGLNLLKSFIANNRGNLKIFSNDGYAHIKENVIKYENRTVGFGGTLINTAFKCDESYYCLASEIREASEQWF